MRRKDFKKVVCFGGEGEGTFVAAWRGRPRWRRGGGKRKEEPVLSPSEGPLKKKGGQGLRTKKPSPQSSDQMSWREKKRKRASGRSKKKEASESG